MVRLYLKAENARFAYIGHCTMPSIKPFFCISIIPFIQIDPVITSETIFRGYSPRHSLRTMTIKLIVCLLYGQSSHYPLEEGGSMILIDIADDIVDIPPDSYSWNRFVCIQLI